MMHYDPLVLCLFCFMMLYDVITFVFKFTCYESYFPLLTDRIEVLYNQENSQPFKRLTGIPGLGLLWLITSSDTACPCFLYIEGATYHTVTYFELPLSSICKKPTKLSTFFFICNKNFKLLA